MQPLANDDEQVRIAIKHQGVDQSPWFEITLFRTHVKCKLPKSTQKAPRDALGRSVDQRPFINTATRENYEINEELGRCITNIYNAAWKVVSKTFLAKHLGEVQLRIYGLGVTKIDRLVYRDLYDPSIATAFLRNYYSTNFADTDLDSLDLIKREFNGNAAYQVTSSLPKIDCFVPFSALDVLLFSFEFMPKKRAVDYERQEFLTALEDLVEEMLATLSMEESPR